MMLIVNVKIHKTLVAIQMWVTTYEGYKQKRKKIQFSLIQTLNADQSPGQSNIEN